MAIYGPTGAEYQQQALRSSAQTGQLLGDVGEMALQNRQLNERQRQFNVASQYKLMKDQLPSYGGNVTLWAMRNPDAARNLLNGMYGEGAANNVFQGLQSGQLTGPALQSLQQDMVARGEATLQQMGGGQQQQAGQGMGQQTSMDQGQRQQQTAPQGQGQQDNFQFVGPQYFQNQSTGGQESGRIGRDQARKLFRSELFGSASQGNVDEQALVNRYAQATGLSPQEIQGFVTPEERQQMQQNPVELYNQARSALGQGPNTLDLAMRSNRQQTTTSQPAPVMRGLQLIDQNYDRETIANMKGDELTQFAGRERQRLEEQGLSPQEARVAVNTAISNAQKGRGIGTVPSEEEMRGQWWMYRDQQGNLNQDLYNQMVGGQGGGQGQQQQQMQEPIGGEGFGRGAVAPLESLQQSVQRIGSRADIPLDKLNEAARKGFDNLDKREQREVKNELDRTKRWVLKEGAAKRLNVPSNVVNKAVDVLNQTQGEFQREMDNPLLFDLYHNKDAIDTMLKQTELKLAAKRLQMSEAELGYSYDKMMMDALDQQNEDFKQAYDMYFKIIEEPLKQLAQDHAGNAEDFQEKFGEFMEKNPAYKAAWENIVDITSKATGTRPEYAELFAKRRFLGVSTPFQRDTGESIAVFGTPATGAMSGGAANQGGDSQIDDAASQYLQSIGYQP